MEDKIYCKTHLEEYAQYYCEECNEILCSHCALSNKHINHINKIKMIEEIIKQKIKAIDDLENFSIYKTSELFQFIINYNSFIIPYDKNYIINSINEQFNAYIGKLIELKMQIINLFSEKFEITSNVLNSTKNIVLETQQKLLLKINSSENKNDFLNKINLCLEKIRLNQNPNEAINFMNDYENLINECFENEDDLNKKYNYYLSYKYLNDFFVGFKDKTVDALIQPFFKNSLNQIGNIINHLNEEGKKENVKIKSKLNEINAEKHFKKENKMKNHVIKNEDNSQKENNNNNIQNEIIFNNIKDNNKMPIEILEENHIKEKEENIKKENKIEENIIQEQIEENNTEEIKKEENEINAIENQKNEEKMKEREIREKELKEKEDIKKKLEEKLKKNNIEKKDNIIFEPPIIEGGIMTQEEINNLKEDDEENFLKKEFENEEKDINDNLMENNMIENSEAEIARNVIDEMDDRLDIQYYEGVKFPEEEGNGILNDNAIIEDDEKKEKNVENIENENNIKEKEDENKNNNNNVEEKIEDNNNNDNKNEIVKNKDKELNALFGVDVKKNKKKEEKDENVEKKSSLNLDTWVNVESIPKNDNRKTMEKAPEKIPDKNKRKTIATKNPVNFMNLFGVSADNKKKVTYEEPKIPAPKNKESLEKLKKLYDIIDSNGKNNNEYNELFNSLTWEEKNYIELISLKSGDTTAFVYNQISNKIEKFDTKIKFPSQQSFINVLPYVYFSGGKIDNKPTTLIRRLRKYNNEFKIEEMGNLREPRSCHSTIYIKSIDSLLFISGTKTKTCEKLNLINKKVEKFPAIKYAREKCGTCLTNNENLYIFFGFDRNKNKIETTIEKINIINPKSWELLKLNSDQNLLKRYSMSCIPINFTNKQGILLVGGLGSLKNDLEDNIFIELDTNNVKKFNLLPFASSFTNTNFLPLTLGISPKYMYNFDNENEIVCFNLENYEFSGLE